MEEEYKSKMCSSCVNPKCCCQITREIKNGIITIKCQQYIYYKTNIKEKYLDHISMEKEFCIIEKHRRQ
jgi:hypothetical protein